MPVQPLRPTVIIQMRREPAHNDFTRLLTFENHLGDFRRLKIAFKKKSGLTWEADNSKDFWLGRLD